MLALSSSLLSSSRTIVRAVLLVGVSGTVARRYGLRRQAQRKVQTSAATGSNGMVLLVLVVSRHTSY
jgi:hypothetical protein